MSLAGACMAMGAGMRTTSLMLTFTFSACDLGPGEAPEQPAGPSAEEAARFTKEADARLLELSKVATIAAWTHQTDITDEHEAAAAKADEALMAYMSEAIPKAATFDSVQTDPETARMLYLLETSPDLPAPSDPAKRAELAEIAARMSSTYGKAKWCRTEGDCLDIEKIEELLATSQDPAELRAAWEGWHEVGKQMRADYQRFVELGNLGAQEIGFKDLGQLWRARYDMPPEDVEKEVDRLWKQVSPLYDALQCHVRAKLNEKYGNELVPPDGLIPSQLSRNLWAQDWLYLYDLLEPYPGQPTLDVSKTLEAQHKTPVEMVKMAEGFFTSMGLDPLPPTFWERSMLTKPADREVVCHASAWDVELDNDLRIKMCIDPTHDDLVTIHHELGHLYQDNANHTLPYLFRGAAHDGFHEAIGDAIALSVTPSYLHEMGLLPEAATSNEAVVNAQMQTALGKIAFLPFGLVVDRWRWEVFDGRVKPDEYNEAWWRLKAELQGVAPPAPRGEEFFDPGAKYHIPGNTPYLRYFFAHILQFQFHEAMCKAAGHQGPLHTCSVFGSKEAGGKLEAMMELGSSKPWPDALEQMTGTRQMDGRALVTYFEPLMAWLAEQNKGRTCGWNADAVAPPPAGTPAQP